MANVKKRGLGRGLGALISVDVNAEPAAAVEPASDETRVLLLDPHAIAPNPKQPRKAFNEEALEELSESIKRDGVQEPVIVRRSGDGYELVTGERRVRASIMAGLDRVPAICRKVSDSEMLRLGLIENVQREDLNPIELAQAYQALIEESRWTQEQLADEVGKKRVTITNTLRLLNLPSEVQRWVVDGTLTSGHARALLAIPSVDGQLAAGKKVIAQGLSVRETEKLAMPPDAKPKKTPEAKDPNVEQIEEELRRLLGTKVSLRTAKRNRGKIEIEYYSFDDLDRILGVVRSSR